MARDKASFKPEPNWVQALEQHFSEGPFCILNSNGFADEHELIVAAGAIGELVLKPGKDPFDELRKFHQTHNDWIFGYLSYDLKNNIEDLLSENNDQLKFPELYFFCPKFVFFLKEDSIECHYPMGIPVSKIEMLLQSKPERGYENNPKVKFRPRLSKEEYLNSVRAIKAHIQRGDIYEMNLCQEFFAEGAGINPFKTYQDLIKASPSPFSCYFHEGNHYIACSSPERYLKKKGKNVVSQPIKGTIRRGINEAEDRQLKAKLRNDPKEQSENVMIVDLVRNDLSKTASRGSVKVEELFGIYSFKHVHHMVSTISSDLKEDCDFVDLLRTSFPMGSMTGAPKIRAMGIIEEFEPMKRGLFSGAIGYVDPVGDMDFNVVIRSIFYNSVNKYLSFMAGSAITIKAVPEKEYEECILKAKALFSIFNDEMD